MYNVSKWLSTGIISRIVLAILVHRRTLGDLLLILLLWIATAVVTDLSGNFPLNDDWSYAVAVINFIEKMEFIPTGWTSMPLLSHVAWGSLFCSPNGFSFECLRYSTLSISLAGIFAVYLILIEVGAARAAALIAASVLAFNPVFFLLSSTFMTDVPFASIMTLSLLFFVRSLKGCSEINYFIAVFLVLFATLNRQIGVAIPLAYAMTLFLRDGFRLPAMFRALFPLMIAIAALYLMQLWLEQNDRLPALYAAKKVLILNGLASIDMDFLLNLIRNIIGSMIYIGWFLLPVVPIVFQGGKGSLPRKLLVFSVAVLSFALLYFLFFPEKSLMPLTGNIINESGFGPLTLTGSYYQGEMALPKIPALFWLFVTIFGMVGIVMLSINVISFLKKIFMHQNKCNFFKKESVLIFLFLSAILLASPAIVLEFSDRYLLPLVPVSIALIFAIYSNVRIKKADKVKPLFYMLSFATLLPMALFSVFGRIDYLEWNRARWEGISYLMESRRIGPEEIDGGFEFNGFYLYSPEYKRKKNKNWWWVISDRYKISFAPVSGHLLIKQIVYKKWLPPHNGSILVLVRQY